MGIQTGANLYSAIASIYRKLMMKKLFVITWVGLVLMGCSKSTPNISKRADLFLKNQKLKARKISESLVAHSNDPQAKTLPKVEKSKEKKKWTQSGNPVDMSKLDAEVEKAEKFLKTKPNDEGAKKIVSQAFYKRGFVLTEARQYASAIGDYRRALKYDPRKRRCKKNGSR